MLTRIRIEVEGESSAAEAESALDRYEAPLHYLEGDRFSFHPSLNEGTGWISVPEWAQSDPGPEAPRELRPVPPYPEKLGREVTDEVIEHDPSYPGWRGRRVIKLTRLDTRGAPLGSAAGERKPRTSVADYMTEVGTYTIARMLERSSAISFQTRQEAARALWLESLSSVAPRRPCKVGWICGGAEWPCEAKYRGGRADDAYCRPCKSLYSAVRNQLFPAEGIAKGHRRRARARGAHSAPYTREEVWAKTLGRCGICGGDIPSILEMTVDHMLPVDGGGEDTLRNVIPAHGSCNSAAGNRRNRKRE